MKRLFLFFVMCILIQFTNAQNNNICFSADTTRSIIMFYINNIISGDSAFSIGKTKKVKFVNGNLMCKKYSTHEAKIAEHQYDYVGGKWKGDTVFQNMQYGTICDTVNGEYTFCWNDAGKKHTGWQDVFEFGEGDIYGISIETGKIYRTPTKSEFDTLFFKRPNAAALRARCRILIHPDTINDVIVHPCDFVNGIIVMPDNWSPEIIPNKIFKSDADGCKYYTDNIFTVEEFNLLETQGAIFFPAAGGLTARKYNRSGFYWTGSADTDPKKPNNGWSLEFGGVNGNKDDLPHFILCDKRSTLRTVRLCIEIEE